MNYMLLLYSDPGAGPQPGTPEFATEMKEWFAYNNAAAEAGVLVSGEPLQPVQTATTVQVRDGETITTDGPFAETKEHLGGFYILDVKDLDEALDWAARIPLAPYGSVEVRPIMEVPDN